MKMAAIHCENQNKKRQIDLAKIRKIVKISLKTLLKSKCDVALMIVSNQKIRAINRKYLNKDNATDVIAFEYNREGNCPGLMKSFLGDIVISSDKAFQNSIEFGTTFLDELTLYVIHGILHLSGYRDSTKTEREIMRRKENDLLQKVKKTI